MIFLSFELKPSKRIHKQIEKLDKEIKLKLLDLKLKEIKAVDNKIFQLKPGFVKKSMKKIYENPYPPIDTLFSKEVYCQAFKNLMSLTL